MPNVIQTPLTLSGQKVKKPAPKLSNKGIADRIAKDLEQEREITSTLESSYVALQRKALLYEKLQEDAGLDSDHEDHLVDFLRKEPLPEESMKKVNPMLAGTREDPCVETTDEFGRTRLIRKSELFIPGPEFLPAQHLDSSQMPSKEESPQDHESLMSRDMEREKKRLEWEEYMRTERGPVHYDNEKEIRTVGTSYYKFSRDEEERMKQMQELNDAREKTERERELQQRKKESRKQELEERKRRILEKSDQRKKRMTESAVDAFLSELQ